MKLTALITLVLAPGKEIPAGESFDLDAKDAEAAIARGFAVKAAAKVKEPASPPPAPPAPPAGGEGGPGSGEGTGT